MVPEIEDGTNRCYFTAPQYELSSIDLVGVVVLLLLFHVKNARKKGNIVVVGSCGVKLEVAECG